MYLSIKFGIITKAYSKEEKRNQKSENFPAKMPNALARIALHQMKLIEKFNDHRIEIANLYEKKLFNNKSIGLPKSTQESKNIYLWYTILVKNKKELIKKAKKHHIILGDWFPQAVGPIKVSLEKSGYKKEDCPVAEKVSSQCVNLPTHYRISEREINKIIGLFSK